MFLPKRLPRLVRRPLSLLRTYGREKKTLSKLWDSSPGNSTQGTLRGLDLPISEPRKESKPIRPWVFSAATSDWVRSENKPESDNLEIGNVLPVILWNLRHFGRDGFNAARASAAMSLLREIFGERPRPMAVMLHEVKLEILRGMLEHELMRRNFQVGFDDTLVTSYAPAADRDPLLSVLMVSYQLRTKNWVLLWDVLSVDLPVGCSDDNQDDKKLLRLGTTYLQFGKRSMRIFEKSSCRVKVSSPEQYQEELKKFKQSQSDKFRRAKLEGIQEYMNNAIWPGRGERVIASVLGCDITESDMRRSKYRWTKTGAAGLPRETQGREGRLVQFRPWHVEESELQELGRFAKHGINGKFDMGCMPEGQWPEVAVDSDWMVDSRYLSEKAKLASHWLGLFPYRGLCWPRNRLQSYDAQDFMTCVRRLKFRKNLSQVEALKQVKECFNEGDFKCPSFAPLFANDPRFNYDLYKGRIYGWISDDFGIAMGIKIVDKGLGKNWRSSAHERSKAPPAKNAGLGMSH